jgi:transcriptional regulator with XRE-family HTH domain
MTGEELRELRERLALTQREAAIRLDVTERTVSRWERGEGGIPALKVEGIRKALNGAKGKPR